MEAHEDEHSPDPGCPRVRFGVEMRRLRKAAELSQSSVAARLGCTQTHVSRLEFAKRTPSKSDAIKLDKLFGLTGKEYFVRLHRRISHQSAGPTWFLGWVEEIEPYARVIRSWDPLLIPGLLQTEDYARNVFKNWPLLKPHEVDARVQSRLRRQRVLDAEDPPLLLILIDEGVLHRQVGDRDVMAGQLDHLLHMAGRPAVCIQLVDRRCIAGSLGAFMIAQLPDGHPDTIHADSSAEGVVTTDKDIVTSLWSRYEAIRLWAYPEHISLQMIEEAKQRWT